jgi:hypothetical protein
MPYRAPNANAHAGRVVRSIKMANRRQRVTAAGSQEEADHVRRDGHVLPGAQKSAAAKISALLHG